MGIALNARDWWAARRQQMVATARDGAELGSAINGRVPRPFVIHSPHEELISQDQKYLTAKHYSGEGAKAGAKAAAIACIVTAIPTLIGARVIPWARTNLNYTAQALIVSTVSGSAFFIVADKTILKSARKNSFEQLENAESPF